MKKILITLLLITSSILVCQAQDAGNSNEMTIMYFALGLITIAFFVTIGIALRMLGLLSKIDSSKEDKKKLSFWANLWVKSNAFVDIKDEEKITLDHNYDGIRELDNHLPPWWNALFYFTIIFSVVYLILYHVSDTLPLSGEEYKIEETSYAAMVSESSSSGSESSSSVVINEETVTVATDEAALADGKQIFVTNCAVCHANDGGGLIGPNFTDDYWIHGGSIKNMYHTIAKGVPAKGMVSWEPILSPEKIRNVASYILTFRGTTPANPKAPEGELYNPEESTSPAE